jgi:hypothetical protein
MTTITLAKIRMPIARREFLAKAAVVAVAPLGLRPTHVLTTESASKMYGLIGEMIAVAGQRDALAAILLGSTGSMPGASAT